MLNAGGYLIPRYIFHFCSQTQLSYSETIWSFCSLPLYSVTLRMYSMLSVVGLFTLAGENINSSWPCELQVLFCLILSDNPSWTLVVTSQVGTEPHSSEYLTENIHSVCGSLLPRTLPYAFCFGSPHLWTTSPKLWRDFQALFRFFNLQWTCKIFLESKMGYSLGSSWFFSFCQVSLSCTSCFSVSLLLAICLSKFFISSLKWKVKSGSPYPIIARSRSPL